jgi:hypothetical protein
MGKQLSEWIGSRHLLDIEEEKVRLSREQMEQLKALGYIVEDEKRRE